jgi:hypothetical protein
MASKGRQGQDLDDSWDHLLTSPVKPDASGGKKGHRAATSATEQADKSSAPTAADHRAWLDQIRQGRVIDDDDDDDDGESAHSAKRRVAFNRDLNSKRAHATPQEHAKRGTAKTNPQQRTTSHSKRRAKRPASSNDVIHLDNSIIDMSPAAKRPTRTMTLDDTLVLDDDDDDDEYNSHNDSILVLDSQEFAPPTLRKDDSIVIVGTTR